jgi:hypothetical protein
LSKVASDRQPLLLDIGRLEKPELLKSRKALATVSITQLLFMAWHRLMTPSTQWA